MSVLRAALVALVLAGAIPAVAEDSVGRSLGASASGADDPPGTRSIHGDWEIRCSTAHDAQGETCVLMQYVVPPGRDDIGLTVIIVETAAKQERLLRVLAPLGVLLPAGLGLKIEQTEFKTVQFVRCVANGCIAEVILSDDLLRAMKAGKVATFFIWQRPEVAIPIPVSLMGFSEGLAKLP